MAEKKTLFHSELVKACENGPVAITVIAESKASKFPNKPPYARINFEGREREYWCDNEAISRFFDGQVGRTFTVMAEGHKGDELLSYVGEAASQTAGTGRARQAAKPKQTRQGTPPPQGNRPPPAAEAPPDNEPEQPASNRPPANQAPQNQTRQAPRETPEQIEANYEARVRELKIAMGRQMVLCAIASDAAEIIAARHALKHGKEMTDERIQGIAMRMMIALGDRAGLLPSGNLDRWLPYEPKAQPSDNDGGAA